MNKNLDRLNRRILAGQIRGRQCDKSVIERPGHSRPEGVASEFAGGTFRSLLSLYSWFLSCLMLCSLRLFLSICIVRFCFLGFCFT